MSPMVPLPKSTRHKVAANTHPGLALDKYANSWDPDSRDSGKLQEKIQKPTLEKVVRLSQAPIEGDLFNTLVERRRKMLADFGAQAFTNKTAGPLTLHLSRASVLENAGICLHPLYGFAYMPGSGLKGMARAYATTCWLPAQGESQRQESEQKVEKVFGTAAEAGSASAGSVVFFDAWPETWPKLGVDIVNNHHTKYYGGSEDPGDWEDPIPVYFLSLQPGVSFHFGLAPRRQDSDPECLQLAKEWLWGALCSFSAGAKTNSGYGSFAVPEGMRQYLRPRPNACCDVEVKLVTPAFLAGASQSQHDCDLRPATLRGLLRWWWRTLHAGYLRRESLRALEAAIWGDTKAGGAVRLTLKRKANLSPSLYDFKDGNAPKMEFKSGNDLQRASDKKTSQGLFYISYGMSESKGKRSYAPVGSAWTIVLSARETNNELRIPADQVLRQAKAALWMLCRHGGVGSKCRKGFGSLSVQSGLSEITLDSLKKEAMDLRKLVGLTGNALPEPASPSINSAIVQSVPTPWTNYWYALDQLGFAVQAFAKRYKHNVEKKALGLPRRIGAPVTGKFTVAKGERHASPVHFHFSKGPGGKLSLDIAAFPSAYLPDFQKSLNFIRQFTEILIQEIENRSKEPGKGTKAAFPTPGTGTSALGKAAAGPAVMPKPAESVEAVLLEEKTKKGGWKARHEASGLSGAINNPDMVPPDKKANDGILLVVASVTNKEIQFRVPSAAEVAAPAKSGQGPAGKGRAGGQGFPGRGGDSKRRR